MSRSHGWQGAGSLPLTRPVSVTWVGHSTIVLELGGGFHVITDPLLRNRVAHLRRFAAPVAPLAKMDVVLVSHGHHDHFDEPSLRRLSGEAVVVVPAGLGAGAARAGFRRVIEVVPGDDVDAAGVRVQVTRAVHPRNRGLRRKVAEPVGYLIGDAQPAFFVGDTDVFPGLEELQGRVHVAALPISGWGPRVPEGHLDPFRAAQALQLVRPQFCVPVHWGTFRPFYRRRPYETDATAAKQFTELARTHAPEVHVRVLQPGETWRVP